MGRFLHHEGLSAGCFNAHHSFSNSATSAWKPDMTNSEELLLLVTNRMENDFVTTAAKMRKAYGTKEIDPRLP